MGGGAGCFPAAGVCAGSGRLSYSNIVSTFDAAGQELTFDAVFTVPIVTDPGLTPLGTASLAGDGSVRVLGRTSATELGSWTTQITSLDLTGTFMGVPLTAVLDADPGKELVGGTTIASSGNRFEVTSFFDIFVDITLSSAPPLTTGRGPLHAELVPTPEPAGLALLVLPLAGLAALHWRRRRNGGMRSDATPCGA